jgi:hypothetical protein
MPDGEATGEDGLSVRLGLGGGFVEVSAVGFDSARATAEGEGIAPPTESGKAFGDVLAVGACATASTVPWRTTFEATAAPQTARPRTSRSAGRRGRCCTMDLMGSPEIGLALIKPFPQHTRPPRSESATGMELG